MAIIEHRPITTTPGLLRCTCGALFTLPSPEARAESFLRHRNDPDAHVLGMARTSTPVPDDAPPPVTVTVWTMPSPYSSMESVVFETVESWGWKDGVFTLVQTDGTETTYPAHNVHHTTTQEA